MKGDLVTRLLLETQQFDDNLAKATKSVRGFSQQGSGLNSVLGGLGKTVGKLAAGIGFATNAADAFNKTIDSSQTFTDFFNKTVLQATTAVDTFYFSLSNGDISNFLNNMNSAIQAAGQLADILDDLETFNIFKSPQMAKFERDRARAEEILKNPKSTSQQKQAARASLDQINKDQLRLSQQSAQKNFNAFMGTLNTEFAKANVNPRISRMIINGLQNGGYDYYIANNKRLEKLEKDRAKIYARAAKNGYQGGRIKWWGEDEYWGRKVLAQTNDKDLIASTQYLTQAYNDETKMVRDRTRSNRAYYKGLTGGRSSRKTKVTSKSDAAHEQKTILEDTIKDINELLHKRDYFIQVGIDDKEVKKQFDQLQKELKVKYQTVLDLKGNILANPSVSMLQEYKRAIDTLRENSTDDEERRNLDKLSSEITKAIDRLNFSVKNIDLTLSDITGATGTAADISMFYKRLEQLQNKWDTITDTILEVKRNLLPQPVEDDTNEFASLNEPGLSPEEYDRRMQLALESANKQVEQNTEATNKLIKKQTEAYEREIAPLKQQQDLIGQGINAVEKIILRILQLGLNPNTDWWQNYKLTEEEKRIGVHKDTQLQIANILAAVNEALANVDVTTGKTRKTSTEIEVPAYYKRALYYRLVNGSDYLNQILDANKLYKVLTTLRESFKNPYSDATIRIEFEGTDPEKLEKIQEYLLNKDTQVQWSSNRLEIESDIQSYQEQLDQLKHDSVFDGISAVTGLANSWEGLTHTLEGTGSVFSKVMATVDTIMNTLVQLERFTESFKEIQNLTDSISSANDYLAEVQNAQNLADQAVRNSVISSQSTELATSKTAEAAAHTANATAIGAETGAMTALATSQGAATASALALYAATKKAAAASIFAAHAYIPFAGVGIASGFVAEMEGVLAAIGAFANGGIVGGTSYSGDKILTRLNSGEMVLNRTQQGNLFNLLNNGIGGTGQVEFKIKGQELVGVLNNYNNKFNKVK